MRTVRGYRVSAVKRYRAYFQRRVARDPEFKRRVLGLKGKTLGCFCKPLACHGDVIVEWIGQQGPKPER